MSIVVNISQKDLEITKMFPTFVMRNRAKIVESEHNIYQTADNTAGFLRQFYFDSLARFRKNIKGASLLLLHTYLTFFSQMRNRERVSSVSPTCARAARPTARKTVQSTCAKVAPNLYQIRLNLVVSNTCEGDRVRRIGVIHTDIYQAANEDEAVGIALISARKKYSMFYDIDLRSIERTCTYRNITPVQP